VDIPGSGTEIDGKRIYLCLTAGDDTERMLDVLDRYGAQAAFFCPQDFLETRGDLLRRMAATGQSIGLLADAADPDLTLAEQLEQGNSTLRSATFGGTRLVLIRNGDEQARQSAQSAGFRVLTPTVDHSPYNLHNSAQAATLLSRVSDHRGSVSIWLDDNAAYAGLRAFLQAAKEAEAHCLAWTETA
jgi:peptidoglycan/xylan/chitin deacetylase (PgdA/CDA1 family)